MKDNKYILVLGLMLILVIVIVVFFTNNKNKENNITNNTSINTDAFNNIFVDNNLIEFDTDEDF